MEITTTMVRFLFPKSGMDVKSSDAQLFQCPKGDGEHERIWVPLRKLEVREFAKNPNMNEVVMAKWLFYKTNLPAYVSYKEFVVKSDISQEQLSKSSYSSHNV